MTFIKGPIHVVVCEHVIVCAKLVQRKPNKPYEPPSSIMDVQTLKLSFKSFNSPSRFKQLLKFSSKQVTLKGNSGIIFLDYSFFMLFWDNQIID